MIADLKPYLQYGDSPIPGVGLVPHHWERMRLKRVLRIVDKRSTTGTETLLSLRRDHGIVVYAEHFARPSQGATTIGFKVVQVGQFVVNRMQANNGLIFSSKLDGLVSPDYSVFAVTRPLANDYLERALRTPQYRTHFRRESTGLGTGSAGFLRLYDDRFLTTTVALPPLEEQLAIIRFLSFANGRLERAIRAKRKIIALLNEQKQAIAHRAITRGLDSSTPLRSSGVQWLGDIPQHWSLRRFKFLAKINTGQVDPRKAEYRDLALIAPNHIESGTGRLLDRETAAEQGADSGKYQVRRGQVIYSKIRPNLRKAAIAPCDCLCSADMYPMSLTTQELSTEYFLLLLLSRPFTKFAVDTSMRVAMPKVNREALGDCLMWYPSLGEQSAILRFVSRESAPLDEALAQLEREVQLVREYRTRLVADVVTGKLDVREATARLPDEPIAEAEPHAEDDGLAEDSESADLPA